MARKRMISPEIWASDSFSTLTDYAKLIFIGLFSQADDEGFGKAKPSYIRSVLFPNDEDRRVADVKKALDEIGCKMSVTLYEVDGISYYCMDNWSEWQKVEKPRISKIPKPPLDVGERGTYAYRGSVGETSGNSRGSVGELNKNKNRIEEEKEYEYSVPEGTPRATSITKFIKPTLEEVKAYCEERKNTVDAQRWIDYYSSNGWKVGRNAMKDWRAAVRTWESNKGNDALYAARTNKSVKTVAHAHFAQERDYSKEDMKAILSRDISEFE